MAGLRAEHTDIAVVLDQPFCRLVRCMQNSKGGALTSRIDQFTVGLHVVFSVYDSNANTTKYALQMHTGVLRN